MYIQPTSKKQTFDQSRIRQIRNLKNLSQNIVAMNVGISQSSYNDLEQGKTKVKVEILLQLAQYLDVDIRCFFESGPVYKQTLGLMEEKRNLERECEALHKEKEKLREFLDEQKQRYFDYRENCEKLLESRNTQLRKKRFYIHLLLFFSLMMICLYSLAIVFRN